MRKIRKHAAVYVIATMYAWYAVGLPFALANPSGPNVVAGEATISGLDTARVTIQQATQRAIINWQQFNIAPNEVTQFIQPDVRAIALNRIFDQNPSHILGRLEANGTVMLLNRNGIIFGPNAQVNVGGLVASSLHLSDANFLRGHYLFEGTGLEGWVKNAGSIHAGYDGVYLLAPNVDNSGIVTSPNGTIVLAAGTKAFLSNRPDGRGFLAEITAPSGQAVNLKDLIADGGHVTLAGRVVNQEGLVQANSVRERQGKIELYASETLTLKGGSRTVARGSDEAVSGGGTILAVADKTQGSATFEQGAVLNVSGGSQGGDGGFVELSGHQVKLGGRFLGDVRSGFEGGRLLIDPVDVDLSGLSGSGLSTITFASPDDLRVTGMFDMDSLAPPLGGEGTMEFIAGRDLLFTDVFLFNHPEGTGASKWNYTGTAVNDIVFSGTNLWTGRGGKIDFQAGRDIRIEQGSLHSSLYTLAGGDIRLVAGRDMIAPSAFDAGTFQFMSGIRVGGPGNLTLTAGRHLLGGLVDGIKAGPGFVLTDGQAQVTVGGDIGSADAYANVTLGKGQVAMTATGDLYLGLVQDKGLVEGFNLAVTTQPDNAVSVTSTAGNIHLKPVSRRNDGLDIIRTIYPASFAASAEQGDIVVESSLMFWPSFTGVVDFFAKNQIYGVTPTRLQFDDFNYQPVFYGFGGALGGEWRLVDVRRAPFDPELRFWLSQPVPASAPAIPNFQFPTFETRDNPLVVKLGAGDPQRLQGLSDAATILRVMDERVSNVPDHQAMPVTFKTGTGDISKLAFELYSPDLKKDILIDSGRDIMELAAHMSASEGAPATVRAARDINLTRPSDVDAGESGIHFHGNGVGTVEAGGSLNLADSQGITFRSGRFPSGDVNQGGLMKIRAGGDLKLTQSRIASHNGASISIHGLGVDALVDASGAPVIVQGNPQALVGSLTTTPGGTTILTVNGEEVIYNGRTVSMDVTDSLSTADALTVHVGLVEQNGRLLLKNGKLVEPLRHKGKPVVLNGQLVLIGDGTIVLTDAQSIQVVRPLGGAVDVGANASGASQDNGILTVRGGGIDIKSVGDVNVNRSRVATFRGGDINITSTKGNINAGSGGRDERVTFVIEDKFIDPVTKELKRIIEVYEVPGSGIFTFYPAPVRRPDGTVEPGDPFPLIFPEFDTPAIKAIGYEIEKAAFFGRDISTLQARQQQLRTERTASFVEEFNNFIDPLLLGNITLLAEEKNIDVPPAGIRGRDVVAATPKGETTGEGTIQGRVRFEADENRPRTGVVPPVVGISVGGGAPPQAAGPSGGSLAPPTAPTGPAAPATATTAAGGSASKSADTASEAVADAATSQAKAEAHSKQVAANKDEDGKKTNIAKGPRMKRGVVIQVDVKPQSGS